MCHSNPWPLIKMYMSINQINQLETFEKSHDF
jgi:hypothetical protein